MQLQEIKLQYIPEDKVFSFQDVLLNQVSLKVVVECLTDKFVQYQRDILEDFVADFTNTIKTAEALDINDIKSLFEEALQLLNTKFKQFAEKVRDIERFQLKGIIQLVVDEVLMASMIGDVTLMIMRDQRTLYSLTNSVDVRAKIDLFSDFIEGELEGGDQILYIGTKISDVMDQHDRKEMEHIIGQEEDQQGVVDFLAELLSTRIGSEHIGFIISYGIQGVFMRSKKSKTRAKRGSKQSLLNLSFLEDTWFRILESDFLRMIKRQILGNRYYLIALILGLLIIFMLYALVSQRITSQSSENKFQTQSGEYIDVTIEDIQKEMLDFQSLEPSSDIKAIKYAEIKQKLEFLESKGKRLEDVEQLKSILQSEYYKGFNIVYIKNLSQFDDTVSGRKTKILTFNNAEISRL